MPRRIRPRSQNPPEASLPFVRLGKLGVNVVDSPLHLSDGELRKAQNAEPFDVRGEEALRKRAGIGLFTSASLGGPVLAMTSVPLPDPAPGVPATELFAPVDDRTWHTLDGATWTDDATVGVFHYAVASRGGLMGWALALGGGITTGFALYTYVGVAEVLTATLSTTFSATTYIAGLGQINDTWYVVTCDTAGGSGKPLKIWQKSGSGFTLALTHNTEGETPERPIGVGTFADRLYIGCRGGVRYWSPDDGLVVDFTANSDEYFESFATLSSALYTASHDGATNRVIGRNGDADWTDHTPGGGGSFSWPAVLGTALYVFNRTSNKIIKFDGATWSTDLDVGATYPTATDVMNLMPFESDLYAIIAFGASRGVAQRSATYGFVTGSLLLNGAMGFY